MRTLRPYVLWSLTWMACALYGCGAEHTPDARGVEQAPDAASAASVDAASAADAASVGDASLAADAGDPILDGGNALDAGEDPRDAGSDESDAGLSSDPDAGSADGGKPTCRNPATWYQDADGDGYGDPAKSMRACTRPAQGRWVSIGGDCQDANPDVHPAQTRYFGTPYTTETGVQSFDYDCSREEEGDPSQARAPASCGLLSITLCVGSGHAPTPRQGRGVDPYCGSTTRTTCRAALGLLGCEAVSEAADAPFRCK
jgi:hypothetical protein